MPPDGTAREIALEMFRHSDLDGEKYVFACWNRNDIRCVCLDWDLTDEELDEVLRRLSSVRRCVSARYGRLSKPCSMSDAKANRDYSREIAGLSHAAWDGMQRIAVCAEDGGGSAEETLKEATSRLRAALDA
jgi:hypothetical protein